MGLDMFLYRATKAQRAELKHLEKIEDDLNKMWFPIVENELPMNYYMLNDSEFTKKQLDLKRQMEAEFAELTERRGFIYGQMLSNIPNGKNSHRFSEEIAYWMKYNALHSYIVNNFADGVDECQEIALSKENIIQLLDDLNKTIGILSTLKRVDGKHNYYEYIVPNDIELPLPTSKGCFFGSQVIDKYYETEAKDAIDVFTMVLNYWDDDYDVWYQASW